MAISPHRGAVQVGWHDHRHCSAAGNWIDNIEIYGQELAIDGPVSTAPLGDNRRLTQTSAAGIGDNGYAPRMAILPDGRIAAVWYDFTFSAVASDVFVAIGPADGTFGQVPFDMAVARRTNLNDRSQEPAFTLPDIAATTDGVLHLVWMTGFGIGDILTATLPPPYTALSAPATLATGVADFLDPPRITAAPTGDVWIFAKDASASGGGQIALWRKPHGQPNFGPSVRPVNGPGPRAFPAMAFDTAANPVLAFSDRSSANALIRLARLDPATGAATEQAFVDVPGNYTRVALAALPAATAPGPAFAIVAEEITGLNASRLTHWTTLAPATARDWALYE